MEFKAILGDFWLVGKKIIWGVYNRGLHPEEYGNIINKFFININQNKQIK